MRSTSPWLAALLGAAVVGVAWFVTAGAGDDAPLRDLPSGELVPAEASGPPGGGSNEVLARLDGIERRLDALAEAVRARPVREPAGPTLAGRVPEPEGEPSAPPTDQPLAVSDDALERVVERIERKKREQRFGKMSNEQMLAEARRLRDRERDMNGSREVLEHLLTRDLESEDRAKALLDLGAVHRGTQEFEASERRLREAMRVAGEDSDVSVHAGYQLIWTYSQAKKPARGLEMADYLLRSRNRAPQLRPWIRWAAAKMALDSGDQTRARTDYRALLEDFRGKKGFEHIVKDATRALKQMQ
ncbi:MAG: hypothetical protein QNJ90_10445 [Planctomycetota bacterium]|nr:hypothetical protein [Planctomycetota bacterium]